MDGQLLAGKVALITGAASGIGASTAKLMAHHGARVALADVDLKGVAENAAAIAENGGQALAVEADVRDGQCVAEMVKRTVERFGRLDCCVNNAGIDGSASPLHEYTEENWRDVLEVNLTGVWLCLKHEISYMLEQGVTGSIVNTASAAGLVGLPLGVSGYVASKHGVVGLTRAAALEYVRQGIRVNAICPGAVRTPMLDDAITSGMTTEAELSSMQPIGRLAAPREVAEAAVWLCADASSFVTGQALAVDGGWTVQ
ncbi:SDR family oxidoreductase [Streptomyces sp. RY43-2]|uniref:SDR family oxidoreductase n=1 Tax=Streptomyces macrolidinus TaxID=2952607 RepID=A0ABT0ZFM7_9ACTN|nr:glucose 1-dehydrogenase [Streptomyces macrolidinus]MCN9242386.1 SDR family oxidoreductase [Streptomyces macrolidinus]